MGSTLQLNKTWIKESKHVERVWASPNICFFLSIMKSVFFNNMKNSTEKLLRWCINKGLRWVSRFPWALGAFVEVKNLAWLFNSYFFFIDESSLLWTCKQEHWPLGLHEGNHKMYILYIQGQSSSIFSPFFFCSYTCLSSGHTFPCPPWPPCLRFMQYFSLKPNKDNTFLLLLIVTVKKCIRKPQLAPHLRPALNKDGLYKEKLQTGGEFLAWGAGNSTA